MLGLVSSEQALAAPKAVVLLVDSFNGNFESENAVAAVRVWQATAGEEAVGGKEEGGFNEGRDDALLGR